MAVTTWTELKAAVEGFLNRSDVDTAIQDDFIPLAEAEMKRRIRRMTQSTTIYISAANLTGPTDLAEPISLRLDTSSPSQDVPLIRPRAVKVCKVRSPGGVAPKIESSERLC